MFKLVVSDPKTRKTYQKEISKGESGLFGRKIGDTMKGDLLGLKGYELKITGGSDKQGFPMRPDMKGVGRKRSLLTGRPGFHPSRQGEKKRKSVRGNTISEEIVQVNTKVIKEGGKKLEELFGKKEEKPAEKKEEPKAEGKPKQEKAEEPEKDEKPAEGDKSEVKKEEQQASEKEKAGESKKSGEEQKSEEKQEPEEPKKGEDSEKGKEEAPAEGGKETKK